MLKEDKPALDGRMVDLFGIVFLVGAVFSLGMFFLPLMAGDYRFIWLSLLFGGFGLIAVISPRSRILTAWMKRWRLRITCVTLSLFCLSGAVFYCRQEGAWAHGPDASLFNFYPHSDAFDSVVQNHLHPAGSRTNGLLEGTWFLDGNSAIAEECFVDMSGKGGAGRLVFDWAAQNYGPLKLDPKKLDALQTALRSLPPSSARPPLDRLLILSYRSGKTWVTRLYNREYLPAPVLKVYAIVGVNVSPYNGDGADKDGAT